MSERVQKNSSYLNGKSTVGTTTRVKDTSTVSGMCPLCIRDCPVMCEISLSAFRGREALYPEPAQYGTSTAGSLKNYGLDWSHFNIQASVFDVHGIKESSEVAIFPNVNIETNIGGVPLRMPIMTGAFGSTDVARVNWDALAIGAALSGVMIIIGENVCGMDAEAKITNGKLAHSKELKRRVEAFRKFWDGKYGDVVVQTNVEDQKLGVDVYALSKLEVNVIERKWGQGAKAIGGEVRINNLEKAILLKKRGYIVIPDPEDPAVQQAFKEGVFNTFERHSRVGIPKEKPFIEDIEWLRKQGAKKRLPENWRIQTIRSGLHDEVCFRSQNRRTKLRWRRRRNRHEPSTHDGRDEHPNSVLGSISAKVRTNTEEERTTRTRPSYGRRLHRGNVNLQIHRYEQFRKRNVDKRSSHGPLTHHRCNEV